MLVDLMLTLNQRHIVNIIDNVDVNVETKLNLRSQQN